MFSLIFRSRRLPAILALTLGGLVAGSFGNRTPQQLGNEGYRLLWRGEAAVPVFREAVALDPAFPWRWSDLATALAMTGRTGEARYAFQRSLELGPDAPALTLRAVNFHFQVGETDAALRLSALVLKQVPEYDSMVFSSALRMGGDIDTILGTMIGDNRRAAESFFVFLMERPGDALQRQAWIWLERRGFATGALGRIWGDWLLKRNFPGEAAIVWKRYAATSPSGYRVVNWIDNPGFESDANGKGFDWALNPPAGVRIGFDSRTAHEGKRSLRFDFAAPGENIDFHHAGQRVWLEPGRYRLSGWVKTQSLSTDEGLSLQADEAATKALTGTNDWTLLTADFTVGPRARLARVQFARRMSWKFDNKLTGTAWVDGIELRRVGGTP